jgi:hypothetical protein
MRKNKHVLVALASATQDRIKLLQKEDQGMYEKLENTSTAPGSSARVVLFEDILRHVVFLCQPNTALVGRFGLTSKFWSPAVWKHQYRLSPPSIAAAVSLAKRKAIDTSIVREITLDFPTETYHDIEEVKNTFVKRFVTSGQGRSLKKLHIHQRQAWAILMIPPGPGLLPATLEDFQYFISGERFEAPTADEFLASFPAAAPFAAGLKRLIIETHADIYSARDDTNPVAIAKACPNLEEFGILWHHRTYSTYGFPAESLKEIKKLLPRAKRIIVPSWAPVLASDLLRHHFRYPKGAIALSAPQLFEYGKTWLQNVIQAVGIDMARVLCTRAASVFELALQWAYSIEMFSHCCELGLPLSILGQHSAVACLLAGPFPKVLGYNFQLQEPVPAKKLFDFVKLFFRKQGDEVDFLATTIRLPSEEHEILKLMPSVPEKVSRVNLIQAALISGSFDILNLVIDQVKQFFFDQYTPQDLMFTSHGKRINPVWHTLYMVSEPPKILVCFKNFHSHPEFTKFLKPLLNEPDPEDRHKFPVMLALAELPELLCIVGTSATYTHEPSVFFDLTSPQCRALITTFLEAKGWMATGQPATIPEFKRPWFTLHMNYIWNYVSKPPK